MTVLYLVEQGATLRKDRDTLVIIKNNSILQRVPAIKVEQIVMFGTVNITTPVIHHLLKEGIDCVFCSSYGRYHGRLVSTESKFGILRQQQLRAADDSDMKLAIAKQMVRGKLVNQRTILMRHNNRSNTHLLEKNVRRLADILKDIHSSNTLDNLIGLEGQGSALYYNGFKQLLKYDLGFASRRRRPPPDPVNSLLSFGYTMLRYNVQAGVNTVGMDPYVGFLHTAEYSRPSLVLDLVEEFRAVIVDSVVLWLINSRVMTEKDFEYDDNTSNAVLLTHEGMRKFLRYYEERIQSKINYPRVGRVSYRRCFELQARQLARVLTGKDPFYQPFLVK